MTGILVLRALRIKIYSRPIYIEICKWTYILLHIFYSDCLVLIWSWFVDLSSMFKRIIVLLCYQFSLTAGVNSPSCILNRYLFTACFLSITKKSAPVNWYTWQCIGMFCIHFSLSLGSHRSNCSLFHQSKYKNVSVPTTVRVAQLLHRCCNTILKKVKWNAQNGGASFQHPSNRCAYVDIDSAALLMIGTGLDSEII